MKDKFNAVRDAVPPGYVELNDDLGALHEVRVPGSLPIDDAVWVLSSKRDETTKRLDLPELKPLSEHGMAVSFWHPSHQEGMIREPVFRKAIRDADGNLDSIKCCGKHYLPGMENHVDKKITPPAGRSFNLRFPKELRPDTLKDGWGGPFSKYEMAAFCFEELKKKFPGRIGEVQPRIKMG